MENQESFLNKWKAVIHRLEDDGKITEEEIQEGFDIPMEWLFSSGISRNEFIGALQSLYKSKNWYYDKDKSVKVFVNLRYFERCGKPVLDVYRNKGFVCITDKTEFSKDVEVDALYEEIIEQRKIVKSRYLTFDLDIPFDQAREILNKIYDSKQVARDLYSMNHFLGEMAENFEEYYKYMQEEKKIIEENKGPIEIIGGLIEPVSDSVNRRNNSISSGKNERISEITPFDERDAFLRELDPERIIKFSTQDKKTGELVNEAYNCYIYKNPQSNNGYLVISEPSAGDRETQAFFVTEQYLEELKEGEGNIDKFWENFTRIYIEEMSRAEFAAEENTYTFRHTSDFETYKQKIEEVVKGVEKKSETSNAKKASRMANMASKRLYGKAKYKEDIEKCKVTRSGYEEAKTIIFGNRELIKANEERNIRHE